jgi:5,10-methylenetetrahydrofolate reductase
LSYPHNITLRSLVRQSAIENRQSKIPCAYLTVMDRNPEAVEKALMNKP